MTNQEQEGNEVESADTTPNTPSCVVMPCDPRELIKVSGSDAERFLQNYCTADVRKILVDEAVETFFPTDKGRVLAYALLVRRESHYLIFGASGLASDLMPHLSKYAVFDDVELADATSTIESFLVVGTQAHEVASAVLDGATDSTFFRTFESPFGAVRVFAEPGRVDDIRHGFFSTGAVEGTESDFNAARISAGVPIVGVDVTDKNLVQEAARTHLAVSFTKGCYLGQEPIARLDAMGHTNREMRTMSFHDRGPAVGDAVLLGEREVGTVTSVAETTDGTVALGVLRTSACEPGSQVDVNGHPGVVSWGPAAFAVDA